MKVLLFVGFSLIILGPNLSLASEFHDGTWISSQNEQLLPVPGAYYVLDETYWVKNPENKSCDEITQTFEMEAWGDYWHEYPNLFRGTGINVAGCILSASSLPGQMGLVVPRSIQAFGAAAARDLDRFLNAHQDKWVLENRIHYKHVVGLNIPLRIEIRHIGQGDPYDIVGETAWFSFKYTVDSKSLLEKFYQLIGETDFTKFSQLVGELFDPVQASHILKAVKNRNYIDGSVFPSVLLDDGTSFSENTGLLARHRDCGGSSCF